MQKKIEIINQRILKILKSKSNIVLLSTKIHIWYFNLKKNKIGRCKITFVILWSFILNVNAISKSISHHLCRAGSGLLVWPLLFLMWTDSWNKRNQEKMDDPFFLIFFNVKMEFHHRNLTLFSLTLHWVQNKKSWKDKCLTFGAKSNSW